MENDFVFDIAAGMLAVAAGTASRGIACAVQDLRVSGVEPKGRAALHVREQLTG
jgi:hypothetical protein